jgi:ribosomal protein S27E
VGKKSKSETETKSERKPDGCPQCGSKKVTFNTAKQKLECKFCGHNWPLE